MKECSVVELKEVLETQTVTLIDVRQPSEFAGGRVAGSKLIPLGQILQRASELDQETPVYLICRSGRRSKMAQQMLTSLGFSKTTNITGGFEAWRQAGFDFDRDERAPWALERQVRFIAGLLVLAGAVLALLVHPYFVFLSGFVGAGLAFAGATDWCGMALLLEKMPWNRRLESE